MKEEKKNPLNNPVFIEREKTIKTVPEKEGREEMLAFPLTPDSEYVVDDSGFMPISEAIKQLKGNSVSAGEIEQSYDFPNGIDNGMKIPINRRTDMKDIAEISTHIMEQTAQITEELEKGRARAKRQKAYEDANAQIIANNSDGAKTE